MVAVAAKPAKIPRSWPLAAPGMPRPGPDFVRAARASGDDVSTVAKGKTKAEDRNVVGAPLQALYDKALRAAGFPLEVGVKGAFEPVRFVPGHLWGQHREALIRQAVDLSAAVPMVDGPRPARVMVIGKNPGREEDEYLRNLIGPSGQLLQEALDKAQVVGFDRWYVTNVCKFLPPFGIRDLSAEWLADCLPLLHMELRIVRPELILCLGADAVKALFGKDATLKSVEGRVLEWSFPCGRTYDDPAEHRCLVAATVNPAQALREEADRRVFERGVERFKLLSDGVRFDRAEDGVDHRVVDTYEDAVRWANVAAAELKKLPAARRLVAWDAEWHGKSPVDKGSYLRTVQVSWADKKAVVFRLRRAGGEAAFVDKHGKPAEQRLFRLLGAFCRQTRCRAVGHFLNADLEWLTTKGGFDPTAHCRVPLHDAADGTPAWQLLRGGRGWLDTSLMTHAIEETAMLGLETLVNRYTPVPRYELRLDAWKSTFCAARKIKAANLDGYGECPEDVLVGVEQGPAEGWGVKLSTAENEQSYACLHGWSLVQLADGSWRKIRDLVRMRYSGEVKAFEDGKVVNAKVTNWHRRAVGQREWFKLRTATTPSGRFGLIGPSLTPDHKVLTRRGKVRVDELVPWQDAILTPETEFSPEQLSVFLGCLLGDGGFVRKNDKQVGFGFGQTAPRAGYAGWKASVFADYGPRRVSTDSCCRYTLPFSRYLAALSAEFPTREVQYHRYRKAVVTPELLAALGDLGLAVWYQDDGTLVDASNCRIYATKLSPREAALVVDWLSGKFGSGVTFNRNGGFVQLTRGAFVAFHAAIRPYVHPDLAYKVPEAPPGPPVIRAGRSPFYETVEAVVPWQVPRTSRGHGVRYCLTVQGAGNFLTQAGFVSNCYDADATRRLCLALLPLLSRDYQGNDCWEPCWESMITTPVLLEMKQAGVLHDQARLRELTETFNAAARVQVEKVRDWAAWPEFNPRSHFQVRELLYGEALNGKPYFDGRPVRLRPDGARCIEAAPLFDTGKPPRAWEEVVAAGLERHLTASTAKASLNILVAEASEAVAEGVRLILDHRFLDQVCKGVLRDPLREDPKDPTSNYLVDEDGDFEYDGGVAAAVCSDGRVRTSLSPTAETGRWKSRNPNLQNISKARDGDYFRLLGPAYDHKLRSMFVAAPGHALIEFDYAGAELAVAAFMSGDEHMIDHVFRNSLPESDPNHYDIHANIAVRVFRLACAPLKSAFKNAGLDRFRTLAKNVIFGLFYGRGAKAIAVQARESRKRGEPEFTVEQAQAIVDEIFATYPRLQPYFAAAAARAYDPRWCRHAYGRCRRVPEARDRGTLGEQERQFKNFGIQGAVASMIDRGLANLQYLRDEVLKAPELFRMILQVHDAGIVEAPFEHVAYLAGSPPTGHGGLIHAALCDGVPFWPSDLSGRPTGQGPYHLDLEVSVMPAWGEKYSYEDALRYGIPTDFAAKPIAA